jgi:hypothetical protein
MWGLGLASFSLAGVILIAFASQIIEVGWSSIGVSLVLMLLGAILYLPIRRIIKPGVPDVDPFVVSEGED